MRIIFADASYWIALMNPRDKSHETAKSVSEELGNHQMVTSEMVLIELLDYNGGIRGGRSAKKL